MATGTNTAGTKLEINTTGTTYVQVKGFTDFSGLGGGSAAVINTTDFDSAAKEKAMGLPDEGQISVSLVYIAKDGGQLAVRAARNTRAATKFRITLSDTTKYEFTAYVLTFDKTGSEDEVIRATTTLEVTGPVTETVPV